MVQRGATRQLKETLEDYIETLDSRINKLENRLREAEAGPGTTKADSTTSTSAASYTKVAACSRQNCVLGMFT